MNRGGGPMCIGISPPHPVECQSTASALPRWPATSRACPRSRTPGWLASTWYIADLTSVVTGIVISGGSAKSR